MGLIAGPPLENALKSAMGANNVATQGVNYAADIAGAVTGEINPGTDAGAKNMQMFVNQVTGNCTTKVVLAGYSQGAEQVHGALDNLGPLASSKIQVGNSDDF